MTDRDPKAVAALAHALADAIARRDETAINSVLAPEFVLRTPGRGGVHRAEFVAGLLAIPGEIVFVRLQDVEVEVAGDSALVSGIQHARVRVDGETIDELRPFVDWFVRADGAGWQLRAALDIAALT